MSENNAMRCEMGTFKKEESPTISVSPQRHVSVTWTLSNFHWLNPIFNNQIIIIASSHGIV